MYISTKRDDVEISQDAKRLDLDLICAFLASSYWAADRSRARVEKSIRNSLCFGAYVDGVQIAFARVVTDKATFAYLADVFVVPAWRGRGISKRLLGEVLAHPDLSEVGMLLRTRDAHGLYRQFQSPEHPEIYMTRPDRRRGAHESAEAP